MNKEGFFGALFFLRNTLGELYTKSEFFITLFISLSSPSSSFSSLFLGIILLSKRTIPLKPDIAGPDSSSNPADSPIFIDLSKFDTGDKKVVFKGDGSNILLTLSLFLACGV